jgi:site-specific DNA recombinase
VIVAHFYDVESGRKSLDSRGRSAAHERFDIPIPRDGSIADLLREAQQPDRRFAVVICESIERVARRMYFGTKIEYELEQAGVALCAADEPIVTGPRAKRATPTLTRRVKQAVSEWYVLQMLELSWDGFLEHVEQGWNIGKPPYGYLAERVPHPVPARREQGLTKHRLIPDPVRGQAVTEIFRLRVMDRLSCRRIAERLQADPVTYPPPVPNRRDTTRGKWTASAVRSILENPKYTGYQVWNRKARKKNGNKANPVSEWVWSSQPRHEPLVTKEMFDAAWPPDTAHPGVRKERVGSRARSAERSYVLRSYVFCVLCGRRMFGKHSKGRDYYCCEPKRDHIRDPDWYGHHPKAVWISQRLMLQAVHGFFQKRVFGPERRTLLEAEIAAATSSVPPEETARIERLRAEAERLERGKERLLDQLMTEDDGGDPLSAAAFRKGIRARFDKLDHERRAVLDQLTQQETTIGPAAGGDATLLDAVPELGLHFTELPEPVQREIYDALRLRVEYDNRDRGVKLQATIMPALIPRVAEITAAAAVTPGDHRDGVDHPFSARPRCGSDSIYRKPDLA